MCNFTSEYPLLKRSPIQVLTGLNIGLTSVIGLSLMLSRRYAAVGKREAV